MRRVTFALVIPLSPILDFRRETMKVRVLSSILWTSLVLPGPSVAKVELVYYTQEYGSQPDFGFGTWKWLGASVSKTGESGLRVSPSPMPDTIILFRYPKSATLTGQSSEFGVSTYVTSRHIHEFTLAPERILFVCPALSKFDVDYLSWALDYYASGNLGAVAKLTKDLSCAIFEHVSDDSSEERSGSFEESEEDKVESDSEVEIVQECGGSSSQAASASSRQPR